MTLLDVDPTQLRQLVGRALAEHGQEIGDTLTACLRSHSPACNPVVLVMLSELRSDFEGILHRVEALEVFRSAPSIDPEFVLQLEQFPPVPAGSVDLVLYACKRIHLTRVTLHTGSAS